MDDIWNESDVEQLLQDIAFAEREIEEKKRSGEDIPDEDVIDVDVYDHGTVITRRRWDGGTV